MAFLSFWTTGEISDAALAPRARLAATALLLGFIDSVASPVPPRPTKPLDSVLAW